MTLRHTSISGERATADSPTVSEISDLLKEADESAYKRLKTLFASDTRKGVIAAFATARRRLDAVAKEENRLLQMYAFEQDIVLAYNASVAVGLDEVGRGPLAGPLVVGAVVLDRSSPIHGLHDSKKISPSQRISLASEIKKRSLAWAIKFVPSTDIDRSGIMYALRYAFRKAIQAIDNQLSSLDLILLDGNPLMLDAREVNIVKGDAKCASIAAASIIAKVARDSYMCTLDKLYPSYGFASHKGYGTVEHRQALGTYGLCPEHRISFCSEFIQETLF